MENRYATSISMNRGTVDDGKPPDPPDKPQPHPDDKPKDPPDKP